MADPLYIESHGHRTRLKWHRARRKGTDAEFTASRIMEAMQLGASVEVDLVVHADRGFAILHDLDLARSTTGTGLVRDTSAAVLRSLELKGNNGAPIGETVMLLEDLCGLLARAPAHPDALLQLDFKEDLSCLDGRTAANFAQAAGPVASRLILSGGDAGAVALLAARTPGLKTGYDPTYPGVLDGLKSVQDFMSFITRALQAAPDAAMIYLDYELVLAADAAGADLIAAVQAAGRQVDAWTIRTVEAETIAAARRLIELNADQITTDDPEKLYEALA